MSHPVGCPQTGQIESPMLDRGAEVVSRTAWVVDGGSLEVQGDVGFGEEVGAEGEEGSVVQQGAMEV